MGGSGTTTPRYTDYLETMHPRFRYGHKAKASTSNSKKKKHGGSKRKKKMMMHGHKCQCKKCKPPGFWARLLLRAKE